MLPKMSLKDIDLIGKRVFCRVDFNVPIDENGRITDDTRIRAALPTIRFILLRGGRLILASHLGRPKGTPDPRYSLAPIAIHLSNLLGKPVTMAQSCIGPEVESMVAGMKDGDVILLENVRFHSGETNNESSFSQQLADLADLYVNDAFGSAHRAHASTEGIARLINPSVVGLLVEKELRYLGNALLQPTPPFVAVVGGSKVSDKIQIIESLLFKVNTLIIGGGMAYTFLRAQGFNVGKSLVEEGLIELARNLLAKAKDKGVELLLPSDHVIATNFSPDADHSVCLTADFPEEMMGLDIGPLTCERFADVISKAGTVLWNGPMGVFEFEQFSRGTFAIAQALAASDAITIIGGGDSAAAIKMSGFADSITHISTGGGATLEFMEGKVLPGVAALSDRPTFGTYNQMMKYA